MYIYIYIYIYILMFVEYLKHIAEQRHQTESILVLGGHNCFWGHKITFISKLLDHFRVAHPAGAKSLFAYMKTAVAFFAKAEGRRLVAILKAGMIQLDQKIDSVTSDFLEMDGSHYMQSPQKRLVVCLYTYI